MSTANEECDNLGRPCLDTHFIKLFKTGDHSDLQVQSKTKIWNVHKAFIGSSARLTEILAQNKTPGPSRIDLSQHGDNQIEVLLYSFYVAEGGSEDGGELKSVIRRFTYDEPSSNDWGGNWRPFQPLVTFYRIASAYDAKNLARACREMIDSLVSESMRESDWLNLFDDFHSFLSQVFRKGADELLSSLRTSITTIIHQQFRNVPLLDRFRILTEDPDSTFAIDMAISAANRSASCLRYQQWGYVPEHSEW